MGLNYAYIKVDQVGIVGAVSLGMADSMGIMTSAAGSSLIPDVFIMVIEGFIIQNTGPAMT